MNDSDEEDYMSSAVSPAGESTEDGDVYANNGDSGVVDSSKVDTAVGLSNPRLSQSRRRMLDLVNKLHSTGWVFELFFA
jgi:hypothetical protein